MNDFPEFMKNELNHISSNQQNTKDIDGYYFEGQDGNQMAFWTYYSDRESKAQIHEFDEYTLCVSGEYVEIFDGVEHILHPGDEVLVPKGTLHYGRLKAGTRTIHCFGGKRIDNEKVMLDVIKNRRSIRKYASDHIPPQAIEQILEAGRLAPSGKNRQPWRFIVYGGTKKSELLDEMGKGIEREERGDALLPRSRYGLADARNTLRIMKEAPIIIIVLNAEGKSPFMGLSSDERIAEIVDSLSIGAAIENMLLEAENLGIGTLWVANTCFAYPELQSYINTSFQLIGAIALGYSLEKPNQRPRKALEEIVEYRMDDV